MRVRELQARIFAARDDLDGRTPGSAAYEHALGRVFTATTDLLDYEGTIPERREAERQQREVELAVVSAKQVYWVAAGHGIAAVAVSLLVLLAGLPRSGLVPLIFLGLYGAFLAFFESLAEGHGHHDRRVLAFVSIVPGVLVVLIALTLISWWWLVLATLFGIGSALAFFSSAVGIDRAEHEPTTRWGT